MASYKMWSFITCFFAYFQGSFILQHVSILYSLLLSNNIHCLYVPYFIYTFIRWWIFGLFLLFGYYEQCCYKHSCTEFLKIYFIDYAITVVPIFPLCPSPPSTPTPSGNPHTIVHYLTLFEELTPCM